MIHNGKLIMGLGGLYTVVLDNGEKIICKARGIFKHNSQKLMIGDNVTVCDDGGYIIDTIKPRKNSLIRPPISNVGVIFITFAAAEPEPQLLTVDKLISIAVHSNIRPVITVTKSDIAPEKALYFKEIYEKAGFKTFISDKENSSSGKIRKYLHDECAGLISCFAGASGVGKSTLMTSLFPELELKTGEISKKILRGKHTTRAVELYSLSELFNDGTDGYIADTPGFSLLDFVKFDFFNKEELLYTFPEFSNFIGKCRYTKCSHLCEDGCAICNAVKDSIISRSRHQSYVLMYNDLKNKHSWDK